MSNEWDRIFFEAWRNTHVLFMWMLFVRNFYNFFKADRCVCLPPFLFLHNCGNNCFSMFFLGKRRLLWVSAGGNILHLTLSLGGILVLMLIFIFAVAVHVIFSWCESKQLQAVLIWSLRSLWFRNVCIILSTWVWNCGCGFRKVRMLVVIFMLAVLIHAGSHGMRTIF